MTVERISDTIQKFNGVSYYKCGPYFQKKGKRLHRVVWEYHNGEIPEGYDIHHIDGDRSNNDAENLQMLPAHDHYAEHMNRPERKEKSRESVRIASEAARKWHSTPDGFQFHSKLAAEYWKNAEEREYICTYCGRRFKTKHVYGKRANRFCGNNCKAAYRRLRIKNGEIPK